MKKLFILLASAFSLTALNAQISSDPAFIRRGDLTTEFKIIFDASKGSGRMMGQESCYAYVGTVTNKSIDDYDIKYANSWTDTRAKFTLNKVEGEENLWELLIEGGIGKFLNIASNVDVQKLMFVFRTKDGVTFTEHLYYPLVNDGYIVSPKSGEVVLRDKPYSFKAVSTIGEVDSLSLNVIYKAKKDTIKCVKYNTDEITLDATLTTAGTYKIDFNLYNDEKVFNDTLQFRVKRCDKLPVNKPVPSYLKEGINYLPEGKVGLVFRAPLTTSVSVVGDFNNWTESEEYEMYKDSIFYWLEFQVPEVDKYYAFMYRIEGGARLPDPYAEWYLDTSSDTQILDRLDSDFKAIVKNRSGVTGYISVLRHTDPNPYQWKYNEGWEAPNKKDLVVYELCIRDFVSRTKTPSGAKPGITLGSIVEVFDKLDYLDSLGVNAIELMPVMEFDSNESWGYNPAFYFALDKVYATKNQFKEFVDECHRRGIAVILDVAFNHTHQRNTFAQLYWDTSKRKATVDNPWVNYEDKHLWSVDQDLNHEYDGTRQYFKRCLQYWLREYNVDGFRMDLAKGFTQKKTTTDAALSEIDPSRMAILQDYGNAVWEVNPNAYYILEYFTKDEKYMSEYGALPWRNKNYSYGQVAEGVGDGSNFVDASGKGGMLEDGWIGYASSHDEERNFYRAKMYGLGDLKKNEASRLARVPEYIAFATLIPGPKMIWQFDEMGYDINLEYGGANISRKPVPWSEGYQALKYDQVPERKRAYLESCKIINLKTRHPELFRSDVVKLQNCSQANVTKMRKIISTTTKDGEDVYVIVLANFSATQAITNTDIFPKTGKWYDYMTGEEFIVESETQPVTLQKGQLAIYSSIKLDNTVEAEDIQDAIDDISVYPTVVDNYVYAYSFSPIESITVYDETGKIKSSSFNTNEVSMAGLTPGCYFVWVQSNGAVKQFKVLKN